LGCSASFPNSLHEKPKPTGPLVIPALQNKDWRELARKRKTAGLYVPPSGAAVTGADGSVGGLGTRDAINSGPQLSGLQPVSNKRIKTEEDVEMDEETSTPPPAEPLKVGPKEEETEDQKALRLLLAGDDPSEGQTIDIIPPPSEDDAYKQDVAELPDSADLDAYERVPVSQFGAALLRGMGWKEGEAATRRVGKNGEKKGMVEPWLPTARPALLGIGAKEKEVFDDGSKTGKKGSGTKRRGKPDTKYMPLLKVEKSSRQGSGDRDSRSGSSSSRRRSPEAEERRSSRRSSVEPDRRRDRDYDRDRYGETRRDSERDGHREDRYRERDRDDKDMDKDRDRDRRRERDYGSSSRRDNDRDEDKRRERERSPDRSRRRDKDRKD